MADKELAYIFGIVFLVLLILFFGLLYYTLGDKPVSTNANLYEEFVEMNENKYIKNKYA